MALFFYEGQLHGALRVYTSEYFGYATSAKQLHRYLFPLDSSDEHFYDWLAKRIVYFSFAEEYDYVLVHRGQPTNGLQAELRKEVKYAAKPAVKAQIKETADNDGLPDQMAAQDPDLQAERQAEPDPTSVPRVKLIEVKQLKEELKQANDVSLCLHMAKELARIERTEQGRDARFYFVEFHRQQTEQTYLGDGGIEKLSELLEDVPGGLAGLVAGKVADSATAKKRKPVPFDSKVKQLNEQAQFLKISKEVVILKTVDVINLIAAVRHFQYMETLYAIPENDVAPSWVNNVIEHIKVSTGKLLLDEVPRP